MTLRPEDLSDLRSLVLEDAPRTRPLGSRLVEGLARVLELELLDEEEDPHIFDHAYELPLPLLHLLKLRLLLTRIQHLSELLFNEKLQMLDEGGWRAL